MKFKHPTNDYIEEVSTGVCLWVFLFGPIYFAVKGVWIHAVASVLLAFLTYGISWLYYPFFAPAIIEKNYLRKGLTRVMEGENICPNCEKPMPHGASWCRACGKKGVSIPFTN